MKKSLVVAIMAVVVIAALLLRRPADNPPPIEGLPWQIETLANGGSRVFSLELAHSTLDDARVRFGEDLEIGILAAHGEAGSLEVYFNSVTAGVIMGKMILVAALDDTTLAGLRARSIRKKQLDATTYQYVLDADDLPLAWRTPIATITFIPDSSLDEETVLKRFGTPQERLRNSDGLEHFLYPEKGLDLTLDNKGKEILQYVAPREFARLRGPLGQSGKPAQTDKP